MSLPSWFPESAQKRPKLAPRSGSTTVAVGLGPRLAPPNPASRRVATPAEVFNALCRNHLDNQLVLNIPERDVGNDKR